MAIDEKMALKLSKRHVYTIFGGLRGGGILDTTSIPFFALWEKSEMPTDEEIKLILQMSKEQGKRWHHTNYLSEGHNTCILFKEDNIWKFHRISWSMGQTWVSRGEGTLMDIAKEEGYIGDE